MTMKRFLTLSFFTLLIAVIIYILYQNKQKDKQQLEFANATISAFPVETLTVKSDSIYQTFKAYGFLEPYNSVYVVGEAKGVVNKVYKQEGDAVQRGDVIVKVNDDLIRANYEMIDQTYQSTKKELEKLQRLEEIGAVAGKDVQKLRLKLAQIEANRTTTKLNLENTAVKATIPGILNHLLIEEGKFLGPGKPVCQIIDMDKLKVEIQLTEKELNVLSKGDLVEIVIGSIDKRIQGTVEYISIASNPVGQYRVRVQIDNSERAISRLGLTVEVIASSLVAVGYVIPIEAVVKEPGGAYVYVVNDGLAIKKAIATGRSIEDKILIEEGLSDGDKVVVKGQGKLGHKSAVSILNEAAN